MMAKKQQKLKGTEKIAESGFAKYRRCSRWGIALLLINLLICCGQLFFSTLVIERLGLDGWYRLNQTLSLVFIILSGIVFVLCLPMLRYTKCPSCGKSVLSKWWNYGRSRRILKCQPVICPHCGEEVETA